MRSSYKYFVNFSSFAIRMGSQCKYQINNNRGVFRTQSNSCDGFVFAKVVHGWKPLTMSVKKIHCRCSTGFQICYRIRLLSNDIIMMTFYLYQNIKNAAMMTLYFASEKLFLKKTLAYSDTELHFSRDIG